MLNPKYHLNPDMFSDTCQKISTREGFGEALLELGEKDKNVVVLTADLSESTKADKFAAKFPERFFEVGVAEQNLAAIGAGLGISGKTAFITSYAVFSPGKNLETIRTTIAYNNANVKIAGHHAGLITGPDGATHQALEDIAIMRVLPNMEVYVPCDSLEAKKATIAASLVKSPSYLRFSREKTPVITTVKTPFTKEVRDFFVTDSPLVTIFATGHMVYQALVAAKNLEEKGIGVIVADVGVIKPLDKNKIVELAVKSGKVVTAEDHQVAGGLGGAVAEILAQEMPLPIEFVGVKDTFGESGDADSLLKKYGLTSTHIQNAVHKHLKTSD